MYLFYNNFWFDANEAEVILSRRRTYSQQYRMEVETHVWTVQGVRQAANQAALTASLNSFEAYMQDGGDIGLYLDDQATLTSHYLISSRSLGGTRMTDLSYPVGRGAEYSTFRTWAFTLEASFAPSTFGFLSPITFQESIVFEGDGGPREIFLETAVGPPQKQQVSQYTTYRATQSGSATQIGYPPSIPPPIWPNALMHPSRSNTKQTESGGALAFDRSWSYSFESAYPLGADPHYLR